MKNFRSLLAVLAVLSALASCGETKEAEYDETLKLSGSVLTIDGNGGTVSATLNSNVNFSVKIQDGIDWVIYGGTRASQPVDNALVFTVSKFQKSVDASRSAVVTISYSGLKDQVLTIVQTPLAQTYLRVSPDNTRFTMDGGVMNVDVQSSVDYTATVSDDWIVADASNPKEGNGKAAFTIQSNTVKSDRDATVTFTTEGLEPIVIEVHQDAYASNIGIKSLADFLEFVSASNVGDYEQHNLEKWVNEEGEICLLCDLDLSQISEWTPIGQATDLTLIKHRSATTDSIRAFGNHYNSGKGIFNGMNHVISGLKIVADDDPSKKYLGFFGPLHNATVKNLVFDESCSITVNRVETATSDAYGFVAPAAIASTIENVVVKGSINIDKSFEESGGFRGLYVGAIVGHLCGNSMNDAIVRNCTFTGKVAELFRKSGEQAIQRDSAA